MKFVPKKLTRTIARTVIKAKKNSPHIFFVGGVAGVIGGTVMACRATMKLEDALDEFHDELDDMKEVGQRRVRTQGDYDEGDYYKDLAYVYGKNTWKLVRLYFPSGAVLTISIAALTGSHVTLAKRNAGLTAALTALSTAFDGYRDRVRAELGEEKELDIYHAVRVEAIEHLDGSKEIVKTVGDTVYSPFARIFDESNGNWTRDAEINRMFIDGQQAWANNRLDVRGHVMLNDVYDLLGMSRTSAGAIYGWVRGSERGDGYIDFGTGRSYNSDFGYTEKSIVLDFNVDGVVYDLIDEV